MKLTIAIPTHNRASSLRETLASLRHLKAPAQVSVECLVVDNNSSDRTADVVSSQPNFPFPLRRVVEPRLGSSHARNRAVEKASGDLIFFIDDDVVVDPDWAIELLEAIEKRGLDAACGLVLPRWPGNLPPWLGPQLYVKLAVHDRAIAGSEGRETLANYFSANVGFRRECFDRFGTFRVDLGVVGGKPMSGEDTELFARIIAAGGAMGFADRAVVHHLIPPERMTRAYFRRKSFAFGVGSAIKGGPSHNHLDKLAKNLVRMLIAMARRDPAQAFYHQLECANFFGYWRGRLKRRKRSAVESVSRLIL
jgi:glycosyltransferase involved in cell wall biosynthesis